MSEIPPTLWTPGESLEVPYVIPTPEELRQRFVDGVWNGRGEPSTVSLDGSLSAVKWPERAPTAVAFVDMDDMVGNLGYSLRLLQHPENGAEIFTHDYGRDMFFDDDDKKAKWPLIRLVKNHAQPGIGMRPVQHIEDIVSMIRSWRSAGVYVAFITSALEGAELSHVDFLAKYFQEACDGIIITSGDYRLVDKGKAAAELLDLLEIEHGIPALHIDDMGHNTSKVRAALTAHTKGVRAATFQHVFNHDTHLGADEGSVHGATPFETFVQANEFLTQQFGGPLHIPLPHFKEMLRTWETEQQDGQLLTS